MLQAPPPPDDDHGARSVPPPRKRAREEPAEVEESGRGWVHANFPVDSNPAWNEHVDKQRAETGEDNSKSDIQVIEALKPDTWTLVGVAPDAPDFEKRLALGQLYGLLQWEVRARMRLYGGFASYPPHIEGIVLAMVSPPRATSNLGIAVAAPILMGAIIFFHQETERARDNGELKLRNYFDHHFISLSIHLVKELPNAILRAPIEEDLPLEPTKESVTTLKGIKGGGAKGPQNAYNSAVAAAKDSLGDAVNTIMGMLRKAARKPAVADRKLRQAWDKFQTVL